MQRPQDVNPRPLTPPAAQETSVLATGPLAIVGGCGHVGLPLGLAFARKGYQVDLVDSSAERVALVNEGRMPFHEDDADALLTQLVCAGLVKATLDPAVLEDAWPPQAGLDTASGLAAGPPTTAAGRFFRRSAKSCQNSTIGLAMKTLTIHRPPMHDRMSTVHSWSTIPLFHFVLKPCITSIERQF